MFLPRFAMQGMSIGGICFQHGHDVKGGITVRGIGQ
jgi:hypothetical protein